MGLIEFVTGGKGTFVSSDAPLPVVMGTGATANTGTTTSVANAIANVTLKAANAGRRGLTVYNDATGATLNVKLGATASAASFTVKVLAGGYYEVPFGYSGIVDAIASTAEGNARVTELTGV